MREQASHLRKTSVHMGDANTKSLPSWAPQVVFVLLVSSALFIMFPAIDLAVSRSFARGATFPLSDNLFLLAIRDANRRFMIYFLILMTLAIFLYALWPQRFKFVPPHKAFFVILTFLLGPLLTVQLLKHFIGRARPRSLFEFGGTADFTPVWQYAAQCSRNCSFPSGEAATAAATLALIVFIPVRWRFLSIALVSPVLLFASINRVLFGAHFLSDVFVAWGLMLCLMVWLWKKVSENARNIDDLIESFGVKSGGTD
ncbi:phosphatase PAP2 family protein [Ochrobactrum sp. BTU1]|uniref:phosphatase PAP2 family protein n=1 Tax=Ochrobactrum sp. BTU1 TaxID=2840456 RepID=UPI001C055293|nr:phosphatase PAP2 family protein [Ochrobactrum sp. BTU1]